MYDSVFIIGPTACGKTALAVKAAAGVNGEIISADSRQIYCGMDIGTGKDVGEYSNGNTVCHLIDIRHPSEKYSLHDYISDCKAAFSDIRSRGKIPVVCGGTGLYAEAVIKGYSLADVSEDGNIRFRLSAYSREELLSELSKYPEVMSRTDLSSKKRIIRAIEIAEKGGSAGSLGVSFVENPLIYMVFRDRQDNKNKIQQRLFQRIGEGMLEEAKRLLGEGLGIPRMKSFGMEYRRMAEYLMNEIDYDKFVELLTTDIFRLAKRQMTWFRGMKRRGIDYHEINMSLCEFDEAVSIIVTAFSEGNKIEPPAD